MSIAQRLLLVVLVVLPGCGLPPPPPPVNPIRFLLVNDVYVLDTLADGSGGLARVATLASRLEAEGPTLFVLAGDVLSPSLLSKYVQGRQMVEGFNAAGLDYATFGNHEFELARDTLVRRIAESRFRWLSANCTEAGGTAFPGVARWDTVRMGGRLVGIFGTTMQGNYRSYVACGDADSAAAMAVDSLGALGAEFIVGLTHQTVAADRALLQREADLDLVLGGHEHHAITERQGERHLLKADANARSAQFATVWGRDGAWRQGVTLVPVDATIRPDSAVAAVTARWQDTLRARLGPERVIGRATAPIEARDQVIRREEGAIASLVTDAQRAGTGSDVALLNAGTLRLDDVIPAGPISTYTIESLFLFPDEARVVTFPLTGRRLREVLEHGVSAGSVGTGAFIQVSGVSFSYDPSAPSGARIQGAIRQVPGDAIEPEESVRVAMTVYPACEGGDGYVIPEAREACRDWQSAPRSADLVRAYIEDRLGGTVTPPGTDRIRRAGP